MHKATRLSPSLSLLVSLLALAGLLTCTWPRATCAQQPESPPAAEGQRGPAVEKNPFKPLAYRSIGPFRGGRSSAVAGVASQPMVYYFGATGGGVWKTTDGGATWESVSDSTFKTGSVGAIGVAESDPNVVYVGMGEETLRGNVSHGDGVYKSTDAGRTWKKSGLEDTRHIARVRVNPKNPDLVYVAAIGHAFGSNTERGVFRSKDGGKTWEKVLYRNDKAGAVDLILDPTNPSIIYAAMWEIVRRPWTFESGGAGSGIFKSTDGGDTWSELTRNTGLPRGIMGRIGITVSPANPDRLWAIIEAEEGGVFRSDNAGKTWTKVNEQRNLRQRAWYYTRIYADPQNPETVYVLNTGFYKSNDGGRTYTNISVPHGDNHDLWIAPNDPARMIESNDGGANVSFNGGRTWSEQDQPTAQFYRVAVDNDFPYHIYGAQQDNSTVKIASRTPDFGISRDDWHDVGGGESGWIAPSPKDSDIVYAGSYGGYLTRYDHRTKQLREVNVYPDNPMGHAPSDLKYRFQWNYPILFSPHDANTMYAAGNVLFRTTNEGQSWEAISPDLTRNDRSKQIAAGGPITKDNTSVEYYDTIFTVMESPVQRGLIWTGSDDGLVQVTRDNGKNWSNVTPGGMPEWIQINSIEASPHDAATAYVAATMYKSDDFRPYLYKTSDYGKSWKKITTGIPEGAFTRVIREDPDRRGLLYAGTETGMYVSYDDGEHWQSFQLNMPAVPVTDLVVQRRDRDLVVATQGRGFWVLDDLPALQQMTDAIRAGQAESQLLKPEDAYRFQGFGAPVPATATIGQNPPGGAVVYYYLKNKPATDVTLEFFDAAGKSIRKFTAKAPPRPTPTPTPTPAGGTAGQQGTSSAPGSAQVQQPPEQPAAPSGEEASAFGAGGGVAAQPRVTTDAGLNRFVWDMRYTDAARFPGMILWGGDVRGPRAVPGTYTVRLTVDGKTLSESFDIRKDPRVTTTTEEFARQFTLLSKIRDKLTETHNAINGIRDVRRQVEDLVKRAADQPGGKVVAESGRSLNAKLTSVEEELYQTKNQSSQDPLNFPIRLNNKLAALASIVASADAPPTVQSYALYEELVTQIDAQLQKFNALMTNDLKAFNRLVREQDIPAVIVKPATPAAAQ
ncbi:MAG: glycosyl hydrolase [Acidobacteria bacterium]|nr:glycosyl hydrolase [Acidobacteriota bacterium]